jgi:hypothetical protein
VDSLLFDVQLTGGQCCGVKVAQQLHGVAKVLTDVLAVVGQFIEGLEASTLGKLNDVTWIKTRFIVDLWDVFLFHHSSPSMPS